MEDFEARQIELAKQGADIEFQSNVIFEDREVSADGEVAFDISNVSLDAHRSIVNVRGLDFKSRYEKNPIVLFNHDYDKPVGRSMWVKHANSEKTILRAGMKFTDATQTAKDTRALVQDKILRGASIGFLSKENIWDDAAKTCFEEDYKDMGLKAPDGLMWYIRKAELCEWSIVSVPSNTDTLSNSLRNVDPYVRMSVTAELLSEKVSTLEKNYTDMLSDLQKEKTERTDERKQLIEIFKDALRQFKAGDVKRKLETLGEVNIERAIQNYINKKKGIF